MGRVDEKIALITGAGRGMGRSHALRLAEEGADLILTDVCASVDPVRYSMASIEDLEETVSLAEKFGGRVASYVADVRDRAAMKAAVDAGVAELGGLDVIVANAGVIIEGTFDSFTEADVATTVDVNLIGVINTCLVGIPHLRERGGGSVICISSAAGIKGNPLTLPYTASKFGVTGVAMALANEVAQESIRVNSIHPTGVPTGIAAPELHELLGSTHSGLGAIYQNALPVERVEPVDVSHAVLYLASDESRYVTGLQFKVDAGVTIR